MKRRIYALLLVFVMLLPAFAVKPAADDVSVTVIAWNEPAIPVDVGTAVVLADYAVQFAAGEEARSDVDWTLNGKGVASFTPSEAGVTALTAEYIDGRKKTVYVVAKNPSDDEYVIYFNDFDTENALEGFTKTSAASRYTVQNSNLIIDAADVDMVRIYLPAWLGDFGNYSITAKVTSTDEKNNTRWNSICYRANGASYPFYHMCVRKTCGTGSGVEFALLTPSYSWDVMESGTHTTNQVTGTYYLYNVQVKDDIILHSIDGNPINYNDTPKTYQAGRIGLIANYSKMHVDYIKVALQLDEPQVKVDETLVVPTAKVENITNAFANVAYPVNAAALENIADAHSVILATDGTDVFGADGSKICALNDVFGVIGKNVVPVFECAAKAAVDGVVNVIKKQTVADASILSSDPEILKYARGKQSLLRGIIDLRGKYKKTLSAADIAEARTLINGNGVKVGLFDASCLDQAAAEELRSMLVTVWAYTSAEDDAALMHAILIGAHGVVTPSPEKVKAAYSLFDKDALTRTPVIIGHRGNPTNAPENSISSYRLGYLNGADVVETDVYISKDGEVVVMHDSDISRTTTGTGNIESLTLAQLKQYNLWGENDKFKTQFPDEKIPTLREIFELMQECEGLKLFIEIKTSKSEVCSKIVALAQEYDMMERISVISFSMTQLVNMHKIAPEISCGYLISSTPSAATDEIAANALNQVIGNVVRNNTTYNPSYTSLTDKFLKAANARGITVWPWTYTSSISDKFAYAFKAGFNGLTTNDAQYTKNNVKYIYAAKKMTVVMGGDRELNVKAVTYGRTISDISDKVNTTVISGSDVVNVVDGKLVGLKEGVAYVMCSYSSNLPIGAAKGRYTVYTDVIRVEVLDTEGKVLGDINGDGDVTSDDAIYLLRHTLFAGDYPVSGYADFTGDCDVTSDDAIYLLRHTLFSADYPLMIQ